MAHFGHRSVLLEQDRLLGDLETTSPRIPDCEKTTQQFHTCGDQGSLGLVFTELGRPFVLRSDNRPCYSSREFHNGILSFYQVDHITSSPHYPQSNGFAEALVGIYQETDGKIS